ncbi:MAG: NAD-dependent epimerase/dehydratase family protein [Pirellula sp.]
MNATILVTGYGGFLGRAICKDLLLRGYRVRGMARNRYLELEHMGVECIRASAVDSTACRQACRGVDAVIHTAALAGVWGAAHDYELANVVATENMLEASQQHRVKAFIYTSSPSVTFDGRAQQNVNEEAPYPTHWLCHYPRTKAIAERKVLESNQPQLATCSLRPHLIWGVGDPHLIPRVIARCKAGRLRRVGSGTNWIDTVHVDQAAVAHRLALERLLDQDTQASGRAYFITDGTPVKCWDWITTILQSAGLRPPSKCISLKAAYRLGACMELVYRMARIQSEPPMTRFVALQLGLDHHFDIASAKKKLGYCPISDRGERIAQLSKDKLVCELTQGKNDA